MDLWKLLKELGVGEMSFTIKFKSSSVNVHGFVVRVSLVE